MGPAPEQTDLVIAKLIGLKNASLEAVIGCVQYRDDDGGLMYWRPRTSHDDCQLLIDWCWDQRIIDKVAEILETTNALLRNGKDAGGYERGFFRGYRHGISHGLTKKARHKFTACYRACVAAGLITESEENDA